MGIAGGLWRVKPEPFCLFLGAAEAFLIPARRRAFCPDADLGSSNRPFSGSIPGWMAQSAVVRDQTSLAVEKRRSNRTVYILRSGARAA
jgi:hypothetical protein